METIYENHNFISVCEFLPNHLYFVTVQNINNGGSCEAIISHTDEVHYFSTDNELVYHNFYGDFGPLSITSFLLSFLHSIKIAVNISEGLFVFDETTQITSLYKFCKKLTNKLATYAGDAFYEKFTNSRFGRKDVAEKLRDKFVKNKIIVYYTSTNNEKRANAAFLISAFAVLYLGFSPRMAYKALQPNKMRYRPFQDASIGLSPYKINMKDCLDALHKASVFGFFNFNDFNVTECTYYENIEHGDINWIIPQKFIAFPGPVEEKNDYYHHPNFYIEYFLCNNVTDVIRLNQRAYDPKCFTMFNFKHHDLYMQDGTDPPDFILKNFMNIVESATGAIAVHCKAGLGRTGSLIGAYLLKHYRMTAKEAIAWIRICRPGSVIGHQQTWLENHEELLWYEGNEWRYKIYGKTEIVPILPYGIYSFEAPKKEFPGLRELLTNLTKSSRYRFIVKNRSKKSKTRLQQMIKSLLEKGKSKNDSKTPKSEQLEATPVEQQESFVSQYSQNPAGQKITDSKNVQYLKEPPRTDDTGNRSAFNYEYSQQEYKKPFPAKNSNVNMYEPTTNYHKALDYFPPTYSNYTNYDGKLPAMHSNPNAFCPNYPENEYPHYPCDKSYSSLTNRKMLGQVEVPQLYSQQPPVDKLYRMKCNNSLTKTIDKNWKQSPITPKYLSQDDLNKKYITNVAPISHQQYEDVCAFDTRVDTISQYSRFNKPFLNKSYLDQSQINSYPDVDSYYNETKTKGYDYTKTSNRSHGFLLSPEDLQSWVETFDDKTEEGNGDKHYALKRTSVT